MKAIKFLFTSDEHGHIRKAPKLQSLINKEKAENPNTMLISSGDVFQGTPESDLQGGRPSLDVVKNANYDLLELGNHDFDNGVPFVKQWLKEAKYPILAGNVIEESTGERLPGADAYKVVDMDGVKVGLIGVVAPETADIARPADIEGLKFTDPVPVVKKAKKELEAQGINLIGVVSHLGLPDDEKLAAEVDGLDFILGGHTHQVLNQPKNINDTLVCQPGSFRDYLGALELNVDEKTGNIVSFDHELIPVEQGTDLGGTVSQGVAAAVERVEKATSTVVTKAPSDFEHDHYRDNTLGQELSTAMREVTGTPVALYNRKAERADIFEGEVTAGQIHQALPFPNNVVKARIKRADLLDTIKKSEEYADHRSLVHNHLNINFAPSQEKAGEFEVAGIDLSLESEEAKQSEWVEFATTDYLAGGGLGYFKGAEILETFGSMRDILEEGLDNKLKTDDKLANPELSAKSIFETLKSGDNSGSL